MTENRRIVLNIAATYGRSLFAMACGILGGRWALMALGQVDYGLQGLVGGLTAFIAFFNGILAAAVGRFYALSVGKSRTDAAAGIEESRRWFSIALVIHTVVPGILLIVGWPIGEWAIRHFLTIPPDRVNACLWVFRFSCVGCFLGMVSVPFNAFYGAKQLIAELTIYGFATTALNISLLYYMVTHPADWLVRYSLWLTALEIVPSLIITFRAMKLFPECRFRLGYCRDVDRFKRLFTYAFWQLFGSLSALLRGQGLAVLVNKYFGPSLNASLSVARNVESKTNALSGAMLAAFTPAITSAYGAGDLDRARTLSLRVCKFSVISSLVFVLPLSVELPYVLRLWLVNPPDCLCLFCYAVMAQFLLNRMTKGHLVLVQAVGRLAFYEGVVVGLAMTILPVAWILIVMGFGPLSIAIALVVCTAFYSFARVPFASRLAGLPAGEWFSGTLVPTILVSVLSLGIGFSFRSSMAESFGRFLISATACEIAVLVLSWHWMLNGPEKTLILEKMRKAFRRVFG